MPEIAERALRKDAERNRQRILAAASELFAERGLSASLNDVAAHAGLGVGTTYRRFANKGELIDALFEQHLDQLTQLADEVALDPDAWAALVTYIERSNQMMQENRGFMEILQNPDYGSQRVGHANARIGPLLEAIVERARQQGKLRPDFAATDIPMIQLALGTLMDRTRRIEPDLYRRYAAMFLDGIRADHGENSPLPIEALDNETAQKLMVRRS